MHSSFSARSPAMQQKLTAPFRKLRNLGLSKQGSKEARASIEDVSFPSVSKCMKDASDMRNKYEGLLANGHIISGAAYDFARSLEAMALYMKESFGEVVDKEIGNIFSLLAKAQLDTAKLLDHFAGHVSRIIVEPTDLLVKDIQQAEILKNAYDEERKLYILSLIQRKSSKAKRWKGSLSDHNIAVNEKSLQEKVDLLTSYVQSLAHRQLEDLLTQGCRYHSAYMCLFSKGFGSVSAVEPMIRQVALNKMIDTTLSEEDVSVNDFISNSEMKTRGNAPKRDSQSDSAVSSPGNLLVRPTEPSSYLSDCLELFHQRPVVTCKSSEVTCKSAPISPLMNHRREDTANVQSSTQETEHESVAMYALPSPLNDSRGLMGIKGMQKLKKRLELFSKQIEKSGVESPRVKPTPDTLANMLSPQRERSKHVRQQDRSDNKCFPNKDLNLFVDCTNRDVFCKHTEEDTRYTQSGPLIDSPSSIKHTFQHGRRAPISVYEELIPLYKSGPIHRSRLLSSRNHDLLLPPPSVPLISELHKLPLPPPGSITPPKSPIQTSTFTHSAPLGKTKHMGIGKPVQTNPFLSSSPSMMIRSLSIPTPIIQLQD